MSDNGALEEKPEPLLDVVALAGGVGAPVWLVAVVPALKATGNSLQNFRSPSRAPPRPSVAEPAATRMPTWRHLSLPTKTLSECLNSETVDARCVAWCIAVLTDGAPTGTTDTDHTATRTTAARATTFRDVFGSSPGATLSDALASGWISGSRGARAFSPSNHDPYAGSGYEGEKASASLEPETHPEARASDNGAPGEEPKTSLNVVVLADGVGAAVWLV